MRPFAIAIATCTRRSGANYINGTLDTGSRDPVWAEALARYAFVDGPSGEYFQEAAARSGTVPKTHNHPYNLGAYGNIMRALQETHDEFPKADILFLEDDLELQPNAVDILRQLASVNDFAPSFLIAGYAPYFLHALRYDYPLARYNVPFYASICCWFSNQAVRELLAYPKLNWCVPFDLTVADAIRRQKIQPWATWPSIAEHMGEVCAMGQSPTRKTYRYGKIDRVPGKF